MNGFPTRQQWIEYLIAIVAGNGIYFFLLEPLFPETLHHRPFELDVGLLLDFLICAGVYLLWRGVKRYRKSARSRP